MALTATPDKIIQARGKWKMLSLYRSPNESPDNYTSSREMLFQPTPFFPVPYIKPRFNDFDQMDREMISFIKHILPVGSGLLQNGTRWFIPAQIRIVGHVQVRNHIWQVNPEAIVIMINGDDKTIQLFDSNAPNVPLPLVNPDQEPQEAILVPTEKISLRSNVLEVSELTATTLLSRGIHRRPIVYTGFYCVGMGQTLMDPRLGPFTHAIISHMNVNMDDLYQLFGRITGRTREWDTYCRTVVFCPSLIERKIKVMEKIAMSLFNRSYIRREMIQTKEYKRVNKE
jgi:hypothetical protein